MLLRAVECVKCGAPIEPGGNFCDQCGTATHSDVCGSERCNSDQTDATRLLAAGAVAKGHVRTWILTWLSEQNRAAPPEVGIDLEFVARVARFSDQRQRRFDYLFFALALVTAVAWLFSMPLVVMLAVAASATEIPVIAAREESYTITSKIHSMTVKTQPQDTDKIPIIKRMITDHVNMNKLLAAL